MMMPLTQVYYFHCWSDRIFIHSVQPPSLSAGGVEVEGGGLVTSEIFKKWELDRISIFRGGNLQPCNSQIGWTIVPI